MIRFGIVGTKVVAALLAVYNTVQPLKLFVASCSGNPALA